MIRELQALYEQDQTDRSVDFDRLDHEQVRQVVDRDRVRRQRVKELLESEALQSPEDYFHAAIVFQHGETLDDFWQAYELAMRGTELGHPSCRQLAAAAYDRWLVNQGKPQKFGTQAGSRDGGPMKLWDVDPAVTDEERAAWGLPPLATVLQWVEERNREREELRQQGLESPE